MQGSSLLNPHAAPYVPLSKAASEKTLEIGNKAPDSAGQNEVNQLPDSLSPDHHFQNLGKPTFSAESSSRSQTMPGSLDDHFQDEISFDIDQDLMLESLSTMFPDVSEDSIGEVFKANDCDMEMTIDMLEQLMDEGDNLPEASGRGSHLDKPGSAEAKQSETTDATWSSERYRGRN